MGLSIQDLGAIGEFIGAFGVMASLIYVGLQIKQTRNVVMADSEASFSQTSREMYLFIAAHPHIAELLAKEHADSDTDLQMMMGFWTAAFFRLEDTYMKHQYGLMGPHALRQVKGTVQTFASSDSGMIAWASHRNRFDEGFSSYVDEVIAETKS